MHTVLIMGGGIVRVTCAINLAARGIPVEVHEAKQYCGKATRDLEYLENWSFPENELDAVRRCDLQPAFDHRPIHVFKAHSPPLRQTTISTHAPLVNRLWRVPISGPIDDGLERQFKDTDVAIHHASHLPEERATVVAWGPWRPNFWVEGIEFRTPGDYCIEVMTDDACAPQVNPS
jgi:hypothetical protein